MSTSAAATVDAPAVEIHEVELAERGKRLHANLERPGMGESPLGFCIPLAGWAVARDGADVTIEIRQGHQVLRRLARSVERPDIASAFPGVPRAERSGFVLLLDAVKLPPTFELSISAIVRGKREPIAHVRGSRRTFEPLPTAGPAPLMVSTLGRSGSTLLLTLLSHHPQIVAFEPATYDSRPFAYQLDAAIAMGSPASRLRLLAGGVQGEGWWLGRPSTVPEDLLRLNEPVRELLLGAPVEQLLRAAVDQAAAFARELGAAQERTDVRYAAEKCSPGFLPRLVRELSADTREIFLVRDFRDVLASMLAFNAKRGYAAFGREHVDSDERFVHWQATIATMLAAGWRERRDGALLVRYEDLVADVPAGLTRILEHLELDSSGSLVSEIVDRAYGRLDRIQHRTTPTTSASTGRWRSDLPEELHELAAELLADPLQEFGYA